MFLYWVVRYQENPDFRRKTSIFQMFLVGVILNSAVEIAHRTACKAGEDIRKILNYLSHVRKLVYLGI